MQAARDSAFLLQQGEEHMREKMNIQLGLQKHRELAEQAEVATHDRIRHLQMRRIREDVSHVHLCTRFFHTSHCYSLDVVLFFLCYKLLNPPKTVIVNLVMSENLIFNSSILCYVVVGKERV